jgi:hypothetical protein
MHIHPHKPHNAAREKMMTKGNYTAKISKTADGLYFVLVVYGRGADERCVPGIRGKHYETRAAAERGAKLMLTKAAA